LPKVKSGGIIAGHDIACPDVKKAVLECLDNFSAIYECDIWFFKKL
jgi:hypothetical protein